MLLTQRVSGCERIHSEAFEIRQALHDWQSGIVRQHAVSRRSAASARQHDGAVALDREHRLRCGHVSHALRCDQVPTRWLDIVLCHCADCSAGLVRCKVS